MGNRHLGAQHAAQKRLNIDFRRLQTIGMIGRPVAVGIAAVHPGVARWRILRSHVYASAGILGGRGLRSIRCQIHKPKPFLLQTCGAAPRGVGGGGGGGQARASVAGIAAGREELPRARRPPLAASPRCPIRTSMPQAGVVCTRISTGTLNSSG